ncbi:MAG: hemerythrin family protein [bacterium]
MLIKFDDSLLTGITDIDIQHKYLFNAINSLEDIDNHEEQLRFAICDIEEYASEHFKTEEQYMAECKYPETEEHIKEHQEFSENYKALQSILDKHDVSDDFLIELKSFLANWIVKHYTEIDVKMAKFIKYSYKKS